MSINIQKINDIVKDSEEINNILSSKKNVTNEIIIRVSDINNEVNTLITKLEELNIELNRNRIIISKEAENIVNENEQRNCIIEHFLPSMTIYSVMKNEEQYKHKMFENNVEHSASEDSDYFKKYNKYEK